MAHIASGAIGQKLTDLLAAIWLQPITLKSDSARSHARELAVAAQAGFVTTFDHEGTLCSTWLITARGLSLITTQRKTK